MADPDLPQAAAARTIVIALDLALILLIVSWQLAGGMTLMRLLLGMVLSLPLCAPLPGLWQRNRRTFAWSTLCVIPYFVIGMTEAVAQPVSRGWSAACLALSLALFATLIAYLRLSRGRPTGHW